ncbi:MAG TPA: hypothetical protein DCZ69_19685 [Syntrophobacteraceae bacterium]|jgi:hypothetical protein|nr:hypothetical protein [Syntrophobacteraceae bacterium]
MIPQLKPLWRDFHMVDPLGEGLREIIYHKVVQENNPLRDLVVTLENLHLDLELAIIILSVVYGADG